MPKTVRKPAATAVAGSKAKAKPVTRKKPVAKAPAAKPAAAKLPAKVKAVKPKAAAAKKPPKKDKMVRDSFNMPAADYALIGELKKRCLALGREVKKSELLRAGLLVLAGLGTPALKEAVSAVPVVKTGRPNKKAK